MSLQNQVCLHPLFGTQIFHFPVEFVANTPTYASCAFAESSIFAFLPSICRSCTCFMFGELWCTDFGLSLFCVCRCSLCRLSCRIYNKNELSCCRPTRRSSRTMIHQASVITLCCSGTSKLSWPSCLMSTIHYLHTYFYLNMFGPRER